ncbi:MAG: hypothetical protein A2096_12085 [Spirochaetes bacterium GWF1_41_5]|nr:MAG: hypothetical protein A2096_12085 [Spirochaetes bacterium GWF1_41_5]HBE03916.1 ATPase [Spirochaetia bacterium]
MITRNLYIQKIMPYIDAPLVKVISGMRRTGKSTILAQLASILNSRGTVQLLNMESLEHENLRNYQTFNNYIKTWQKSISGKRYLLIDEVQEINGWEKVINSLLAENKMDIIITGSNAHLLSNELSTYLTGRYIEFSVYPLSFAEFLDFRYLGADSPEKNSEFNKWLRYGGLPGIHAFPLGDELSLPYLNSVLSSILLSDVVQRFRIRDVGVLERIFRFILDNVGSISTAKKISDYFKSQKIKISVDTVLSYLSHLESAYLIHRAPRFDIKGKRHLELYDKYYANEPGLRHAFTGYADRDINGLLENTVFMELKRRAYQVFVGKQGEREIDFVAVKNGRIRYFQVACHLADAKIIEREFGNLRLIPDQHSKTVLSMDTILNPLDGINHRNIIDFLLEAETDNNSTFIYA